MTIRDKWVLLIGAAIFGGASVFIFRIMAFVTASINAALK